MADRQTKNQEIITPVQNHARTKILLWEYSFFVLLTPPSQEEQRHLSSLRPFRGEEEPKDPESESRKDRTILIERTDNWKECPTWTETSNFSKLFMATAQILFWSGILTCLSAICWGSCSSFALFFFFFKAGGPAASRSSNLSCAKRFHDQQDFSFLKWGNAAFADPSFLHHLLWPSRILISHIEGTSRAFCPGGSSFWEDSGHLALADSYFFNATDLDLSKSAPFFFSIRESKKQENHM